MRKKLVVNAVAMCAWSIACQAETVSYSIPVLTVRSDGRTVVPGSGRLQKCPFSFFETTNATPVRVSIMEDVPSGAGNSMRGSVWLAVTTAALALNRDLSGETINFETSGYVDGPSAGGMLCLAVMSAIEGRAFPDDFAMTGTIMADGTVGAVGGVAEKIRAASKAGVKRLCIPSSMRLDVDDNYTDLLDLGKSLDIEIHQVTTIAEAYQVLHHLPVRQLERVNPVEICRLPPHVEVVLKDRCRDFAKGCPQDDSLLNGGFKRSFGEFVAGLFGAAAMDLVSGLNELALKSRIVDFPNSEKYPALEHEMPTNASSVVSNLLGGGPSRQNFVKELLALHQDLKEVEKSVDDGVSADEAETDVEHSKSGNAVAEQKDDWFDDTVESPSEAQFIGMSNNYIAYSQALQAWSADLTSRIDKIEDWNSLSAEDLNTIRSWLILKLNLLIENSLCQKDGENYERLNGLYGSLLGSIPYIRPNANARQIESLFYRTMKAMDLSIGELEVGGDFRVLRYKAILGRAECLHEQAVENDQSAPAAIFSEVQVLAAACSLLMRYDRTVSDNAAYFSAAVTTARENALVHIKECRKMGIPCVMPAMCFQMAESRRDDRTSGDDQKKFDVLENYLAASLGSKALILCFAGQKPELNPKGYCCKTVEWNDQTLVVRYLGVDGEPILRRGFSGYRIQEKDGEVYTAWLDLKGRSVRCCSSNEWFLLDYDASDRAVRKTYCDNAWKPTVGEDGVLFISYEYDENGNETSRDCFGGMSNRVLNAEGIATVKSRYNKRGQVIWRRYYGAKGEAIFHKDGNAGYEATYDKKGNQRKFTFVDREGNPVMTSQGYAIAESKFDAQNKEIDRAWFDAKGKLVCVDGVARVRCEYDDAGNIAVMKFFGADDRLTRNKENVSAMAWSYNQAGEAIECRYYGPDGEATQDKKGVASWKANLNASGRSVGRQYYDIDGNALENIDVSAMP